MAIVGFTTSLASTTANTRSMNGSFALGSRGVSLIAERSARISPLLRGAGREEAEARTEVLDAGNRMPAAAASSAIVVGGRCPAQRNPHPVRLGLRDAGVRSSAGTKPILMKSAPRSFCPRIAAVTSPALPELERAQQVARQVQERRRIGGLGVPTGTALGEKRIRTGHLSIAGDAEREHELLGAGRIRELEQMGVHVVEAGARCTSPAISTELPGVSVVIAAIRSPSMSTGDIAQATSRSRRRRRSRVREQGSCRDQSAQQGLCVAGGELAPAGVGEISPVGVECRDVLCDQRRRCEAPIAAVKSGWSVPTACTRAGADAGSGRAPRCPRTTVLRQRLPRGVSVLWISAACSEQGARRRWPGTC